MDNRNFSEIGHRVDTNNDNLIQFFDKATGRTVFKVNRRKRRIEYRDRNQWASLPLETFLATLVQTCGLVLCRQEEESDELSSDNIPA